jgi:hypothetical protein
MTDTGMHYAGGMGFPEKVGESVTLVQNVRLPRDVILSNGGLCIELTLLWASVLEHLGIDSYVFLIPGHAFIVVFSGGRPFPVECTAITPKAVGSNARILFIKAYEIALKEFNEARNNHIYIAINPQKLQIQGIEPPELPDINVDQVKRIIADRSPRPAKK